MGDIHYIVESLKAAPFNYDCDILSFSEKSPQELLQLLTDVFSQISPKHKKVDVSREDPDTTADRLINFLKIVKYKPPVDAASFRQELAAGDREAVYPVLKWVLPQSQQLGKRAFVGYYMSYPEMPEDLHFDPDVMELKDDIRRLQADFVGVHKAAEASKAQASDAQALRSRIKQLEEEKERLGEKVARAKAQVAGVHDRDRLLDVCSALRRQQDEEVSLSQQVQAQTAQLQKAEAGYSKVAARLRELSAAAGGGGGEGGGGGGGPDRLLAALREDVSGLRAQVGERYPKELEKRQRRLQALQEALHGGVSTEGDLQRLQAQAASLQQQLSDAAERRAAADKARSGNKAYLQLRQAQQMVAMVGRKREEMAAKLERLQEKKAALAAQYERQAAAVEQGGSGGGSSGGAGPSCTEEEWRRKYDNVKEKLPVYKKHKKELGDIEAEVFVLAHTEDALGRQEAALGEAVRRAEQKSGVRGFADVATTLEKVSEAKSALDEAKGSTLQQISRTVEDINAALQDRKVRLKPLVAKLRSVRSAVADLEAELAEKNGTLSAAVGAAGGSDVSALVAEVGAAERQYHLLNAQLHITDTNIKRVTGGPAAEVIKDKYAAKVAEAEGTAKRLRETQKMLKESAASGVTQMDMMNDMIRLLTLKLELQARGPGSGGGGVHGAKSHSYDTAAGNVFVL